MRHKRRNCRDHINQLRGAKERNRQATKCLCVCAECVAIDEKPGEPCVTFDNKSRRLSVINKTEIESANIEQGGTVAKPSVQTIINPRRRHRTVCKEAVRR